MERIITIRDGLDIYSFAMRISLSRNGNLEIAEEDARIDALIYAFDKGIKLSDDFLVYID
jgi:ribosome assembly protein YihI (activator of Der GTPase)